MYEFSLDKKNGTSKPIYKVAYDTQQEDIRLYAKGTLSISSNQAFTKVVINISTQGLKRLAPITADTGAIAAQAQGDKTVTWTGNTNNLTLTVGEKGDYGSDKNTDGSSKAGQLDFVSIYIE